jgi:hypothetical protein
MFVSRTVAANVLMEAESNRAGYAALKTLEREGGLRFSLEYVSFPLSYDYIERTCTSSLVEDLIKVGRSGTIFPDSGHHSKALHSSRSSGFTPSRRRP